MRHTVRALAKAKSSRALEKLSPPTIKHQEFQQRLECPDTTLLIVNGPSGTGKTFGATYEGLRQTKNGRYNKVVITRPTIATDAENAGFLPGNLNKKMEPWLMPIYDTLYQTNNQNSSDNLEVAPISHMRGRTFHNSFIVADEMQNSTPIQMQTLLTRIGEQSKVVLTGDLQQSDVQGENGLEEFIRLYHAYTGDTSNMCEIIFGTEHIQRSEFTKRIVDIYNTID